MTHAVVVYHSGFGHTQAVARSVKEGYERAKGASATLVNADDLPDMNPDRTLGPEWDVFLQADAIIMGSPTYMGTVSAGFKRFMDASGAFWMTQAWRDKIAAGFTNAGALSGDKLNTLVTMSVFAAQHSMVWVSQGIMTDEATGTNRMGSYLGLMTQSDNESPEVTPPAHDHETARAFGERVALATERWVRGNASS